MHANLARTLLTLATGIAVAVPMAQAADETMVSAVWGGGSVVTQAERGSAAVNAPTNETFAGRLPAGCVASLPAGIIPARLAVVRMSGAVETMDLDEADTRANNSNHADDIWVVGSCK